ncbi:MAG: hypothetical protein QGI43_07105 [Gemmatimonadota bacterium]|nr:hypothetical protein [Gemmatimonadota bacterium]MDP7030757.1 hypothetical protein [Gemmatimonadota bacterium]
MDFQGILLYVVLAASGGAVYALARLLRLPATGVTLCAGVLLGRAGAEVLSFETLSRTMPGIVLHTGVLLGVVGHRLGEGMLRRPPHAILWGMVPPVALSAMALGVAVLALPDVLADPGSSKTLLPFFVPLAVALAPFPLLALRDFRSAPPANVGAIFLVSVLLVGVVYSSMPPLRWAQEYSARVLWRNPLLVLGESGALGLAAAIVYLLLVRRARVHGRLVLATMLLWGAWQVPRLLLWLPFVMLGFGIALGRTGETIASTAGRREWFFHDAPLAFVAGLSFAPDLFREELAVPALVFSTALLAVTLAIRRALPTGRTLVTGPGALYLACALLLRWEPRTGGVGRYAIDFVLPAWVMLRVVFAWLEGWRPIRPDRVRRVFAQARFTKKTISSESES